MDLRADAGSCRRRKVLSCPIQKVLGHCGFSLRGACPFSHEQVMMTPARWGEGFSKMNGGSSSGVNWHLGKRQIETDVGRQTHLLLPTGRIRRCWWVGDSL